MRIEVKSTEVEVLQGISKNSGKPYTMHKQTAVAHHREEVRRLSLTLAPGQQPYAPGHYVIDDSSYFIDNFGSLKIGRLTLRPVAAEQRKAG